MSFTETLVILVVAVIVFGPKRLPEMARKLGHWSGMLRRASDEFKRQLMTMDQTVSDTLNSATGELDTLVPTDEELGQAMDFSVEPELPDVSPDETGGDWPVPGGVLGEPSAVEAKVAAPAAEGSAPLSGLASVVRHPHAHREADVASAPRSLGLSPTRKETRRG